MERDCARRRDPCGVCDEDYRRKKPSPNYLMQRVIGRGQVLKRCARTALCPPCGLCPCRATLKDVCVAGAPCYEELPCHERGVILLCVRIPLIARVCADGQVDSFPAEIEETLRIRLSCPRAECWRHQIKVSAAVRLCDAGCLGTDGCFAARLDVCLDGYLLADCLVCDPCDEVCPPRHLPLYPQPRL